MFKAQNMAYNAALSSSQLIDMIAENIINSGTDGHKAKRWAFSDFMIGGDVVDRGVSWDQGKQEPRIGEWTKMMIRGRGLFTVKDPRSNETMYTRLGDFHLDAQGNMVTKEGYQVQGIPLEGAATALGRIDPQDPDVYSKVNPGLVDPFNNPITNNATQLNPAGSPVGGTENINLALDQRNGRYLGKFEKMYVGEDGIIYGRDGQNLVSLYKIRVVNFNNPEGLKDAKGGIFWKATEKSGLPTQGATESTVISEAVEKSNVWLKQETHYIAGAQRAYQAATQLHKLADKINATAIEMIS